MLLKKTIYHLDELKAVLDKEHAALSASKVAAAEQGQWEYANELRYMEMHLQDYMESIWPLQPALV